jgi:hypothetical protein
LTPYIKRSFTRKILELNIPDYYLLNEKYTKIIIRELAFKNINENDIGFNFIKTYKINFYKEFNL